MACRMEAKKRSNVVVDGSSEQMVEQADTNLSFRVVVKWTSKRMSCSNVGWTEFHSFFFFFFFFLMGVVVVVLGGMVAVMVGVMVGCSQYGT